MQSYLQKLPISLLTSVSKQSDCQASTFLGHLPTLRSTRITQPGRNRRTFCVFLCIGICSTTVLSVGFNPVQKLPTYEFLNKENKQCESKTHKTHMHRDFPLDPKTGTTSLIFSLCSFQCYNTYLYMPKHPIPWTENHRVQNHGPKTIMSITMCKKHAQNHR